MKETIEWFSVTDSKRPDDGEEILMQLDDGDNQGVFPGFHTKRGFILTHGDYVTPSMWCYFPKGQQ
jgi:hypothetical protein